MHHRSSLILIVFLATLSVCHFVFAQVRSSANYRIDNDTISSGGTENSTSPNYSISDTLGDMAPGASASTNYNLNAGYRGSFIDTSISITSPADATLTPLSLAQNSAVGSAGWTVETPDTAGYTMTIKASTTPALRDSSTGKSFADFSTSSPSTWSVSNAYVFGWSAFGTHVSGFGSGSSCESSSNVPSATLLWKGFFGTTTYTIASTNGANPGGTLTTGCFATEQKTVFAPAGTYRADVTVTATAN